MAKTNERWLFVWLVYTFRVQKNVLWLPKSWWFGTRFSRWWWRMHCVMAICRGSWMRFFEVQQSTLRTEKEKNYFFFKFKKSIITFTIFVRLENFFMITRFAWCVLYARRANVEHFSVSIRAVRWCRTCTLLPSIGVKSFKVCFFLELFFPVFGFYCVGFFSPLNLI